MFRTSVSIAHEDHDAPVVQSFTDEALAGELAAQVRSAFPDLRFSTATVEERGGDHRVLLLDGIYAFRFPRETMHGLDVELAVLAALHGQCDIAVPEYRFVDPAGRFAGYPFIMGDELTPLRFAALTATVQNRVLDQAGRFLAALHGLIPDDVLPAERWPIIATAARQVAGARARQLPRIARPFPKLGQLVAEFYDKCSRDVPGSQVILHGDLVDDHILLARDGGSLAGIIDFADVALGDPAQDLLGFWVYGSDAVNRVIAAYQLDENDDLHGRSYRAFLRYRIDRFAELLAADGSEAAEGSVAELTELLMAADLPAYPVARQVSQDTNYTQRRWL